MLGFKTFDSARRTLRGIELMHMIKKGQMILADGKPLSAADQGHRCAEERSASFRVTLDWCASSVGTSYAG